MFLRPPTYVTIIIAKGKSAIAEGNSPSRLAGTESPYVIAENGGEAQELLRRQRFGFGYDPSNPKGSNEESSELQNVQLPTPHNTYAFRTNDHSNIGEIPDYLDGFLDAGLRSEYTEASLTNIPTWMDQTDFDKGSFNSFLESMVDFRQDNTLAGFDSTSDAGIHGSELRTTYAAQ
jgi:hypothetical protein